MRRNEWQPAYDQIRPFIEDAARTQFKPADLQNGFKYWAVGQVLTDTGLSDDELSEAIRLDGRSDLGLDGFYEDADGETLFLFQSKFHSSATAVGNAELAAFRASLEKLLNPEVVLAAQNPLIQDAHRAAREAVAADWTLAFVFITSGYLSPEGRTFASEYRSSTITADSVEVRQDLIIYDLEGLVELYESHLTPAHPKTDIELRLTPGRYFESSVSGFKVLVADIPAAEIVTAFREHQYALFKLNPRGPLQNKTNRDIRATLTDPGKRRYLFHLNNGITALCSGLAVAPNGESASIRDFQIVNGCQTTVTLWNSRSVVEGDEDVRILLRVIEGLAGIGEEIAVATNTQARLKAQDFRSRDKLQLDLKRQFDARPNPIFYEVKRGDWEMETQKGRYAERIKMVDLAQATLAFLGEPGDAKDKSRTIFENDARYKKVFPDGVRDAQLMLPWHVYQEAKNLCSSWPFSGAKYARFCLTAIAGAELAPANVLLAPQTAVRLTSEVERTRGILRRAQQTIVSVHATLGKEYPGHREFFRSADFFTKIMEAYRNQPV